MSANLRLFFELAMFLAKKNRHLYVAPSEFMLHLSVSNAKKISSESFKTENRAQNGLTFLLVASVSFVAERLVVGGALENS